MSSSLAKRYVLWDDRAEREVGIYVSREEARLALIEYKNKGGRKPPRRGLGRDDRRSDYEVIEVDADYPGELSDPPRGSPRDLQGHAGGSDWYRQASSEIATRMRAGHGFDQALASTARVYHLTAEQRMTLRRMFESAEQHGASMASGMYDDHVSYRPVADMDSTPAQQLRAMNETIAWLKSLPRGSKVHGDAIEGLVGRYEEQRSLHARILAEQAPGRGQGGQRRHHHGRTAGGMPMDRQRMLIRDQQTVLAIREIKARLDAGRTFAQAFAAVARATRLDKAQQQDIIKIFDAHSPQTRPHLALSLSKGRAASTTLRADVVEKPHGKGFHVRLLDAVGETLMEGHADTRAEVKLLVAKMRRRHREETLARAARRAQSGKSSGVLAGRTAGMGAATPP